MSALESWVPGGTVQRYRWINGGGSSPPEQVITHENRFLARTNLGHQVAPCLFCRWCLEVRGVQDGRLVQGTNCTIIGPGVVEPTPPREPGNGRLPVGVFDPGGMLVAHIDPWGGSDGEGRRANARSTANLVVHFAGEDPAETLPQVLDALARRKERDCTVYLLAVVRPGMVRPELETGSREDAGLQIAWAVDPEGTWRRRFAVVETPATSLVLPGGDRPWYHVGRPGAEELRKAMERFLVPSPTVSHRQVRLRVGIGDLAPDFLIEFDTGRRVALRTLRGRPVVLAFWVSWSDPSLDELVRLQEAYDGGDRHAPLILAVNDGEDPDVARDALRGRDIELQMVADPRRRVARRYGVSCWPTVVRVDEQRVVRDILFGRSPLLADEGGEEAYEPGA
jgi:peroxiredoxin